jgi:hypothetical protein
MVRRAYAQVRTHWLFTGLLVVAAALRILAVITYRPAFFFTGDSVGYLDNSAHLVPGQARPIGYAVFLRIVLVSHRLILVPIIQHLMGLVVATITYSLLCRLGIRRGMAVVATLFVLFDPLQLVMEQNLLSDVLFQVFVVASLALLVWRRVPSFAACAGVGLGLAAATLTRNIGMVLVIPVGLYVVFVLRHIGWLRILTLLLAFGLPLVAYAGWFDAVYGQFNIQDYGGRFLYGRVAPFTSCAGMRVPVDERPLCPTPGPRSSWPTWYVFGPPSPFLREPFASSPKANQLAMDFATRAIRHDPTAYASAVTKDFLAYFDPVRTTGPNADPIRIDFQFRLSTLTAYPSPQIDAWIRRADQSPGAHATVVRGLARLLHDWDGDFYFPGPLFALAILLGFAGALGLTRRRQRRIGAEGVLYAGTAVVLLLGPVATVVLDFRYLVPVFPLLGTAGVIGVASLVPRLRTPSASTVRAAQEESPAAPSSELPVPAGMTSSR